MTVRKSDLVFVEDGIAHPGDEHHRHQEWNSSFIRHVAPSVVKKMRDNKVVVGLHEAEK